MQTWEQTLADNRRYNQPVPTDREAASLWLDWIERGTSLADAGRR